MAPALPAPPREPRDPSPRRRALSSVDNCVPHMDDEMGIQTQPSLVKDSQEMEQILVDLTSSDIAQSDLLQAIKTLETASAEALAADPDAIFPLSGFDLGEVADSESDPVEDKIKVMQMRLERRCTLLQRRLRILQARAIGKRVSEDVAQTFDKCVKAVRKDGAGRPVGLKAMLKKIETTANLQACAASRNVVGPKYYNPSTSKADACLSASIGIASGTLSGLQDTAGALRSHLSLVKHELDSDATASSSGAESNDEDVIYNNPHQQPMPIEKRALWRWQRARAGIASRWGWLQTQVHELEYKIRQHIDLHRQVREAKGAVQFEGEPAAYEGSLPGSEAADDDEPATETCARVRPLKRDTFRKRKLLQMHNLHHATDKAAKPSDIRCSCINPEESCPICTGRAEPTEPAPLFGTLPPSQRLARVDPSYHPVLSTPDDIPRHVHVSAVASRPWFRSRMSRLWRGTHTPASPTTSNEHKSKPKTPKHHSTRLKRGRPPLSRKIRMTRENSRIEETTLPVERERRSVGRPSMERRRSNYNIDNIVIPASVAANNKPMILAYKEILTPKWRVKDITKVPLNNGVMKSAHRMSLESEEEDISEEAVLARHQRALTRERNRYLRAHRGRRLPTGMPPAEPIDPLAPPPAPLTPPAVVQPYSPRRFPLPEDTYHSMLWAMPEGHRSSSPSPPSEDDDDDDDIDAQNDDLDMDRSSTMSPMSPSNLYEGDDPDDMEWDPISEKQERKKSTFRYTRSTTLYVALRERQPPPALASPSPRRAEGDARAGGGCRDIPLSQDDIERRAARAGSNNL